MQHRSDNWESSVIQFKTNNPQRLPIVDVALRDVGSNAQEFAIAVGPVCFK